jgi:hypothetical protein
MNFAMMLMSVFVFNVEAEHRELLTPPKMFPSIQKELLVETEKNKAPIQPKANEELLTPPKPPKTNEELLTPPKPTQDKKTSSQKFRYERFPRRRFFRF